MDTTTIRYEKEIRKEKSVMALTAQEIKKRYDIANKEKENFRALYEECYEYALPNRNLYDGFYRTSSLPKGTGVVYSLVRR